MSWCRRTVSFRKAFHVVSIVALVGCMSGKVQTSETPDETSSGPGSLSVESKKYDWSAYGKTAIAKIRENWQVPAMADQGARGGVKVRFFVSRDGSIEAPEVLSSSRIDKLDNAAIQAVLRSSPLAPFPADVTSKRERMTITFWYNLKPPPRPIPTPGSRE